MGRVVLSELQPGDARDAADVNANFDAIEAESTSVDEENVMEEGLNEFVLADELIGQHSNTSTFFADDSLIITRTNTSYAQISGAGALRITPGLIPANGLLHIEGSVHLPWITTVPGIPIARKVSVAIYYQLSGGGPTLLTNSVREAEHEDVVGNDGVATTIEVDGILPAGDYDWVELQSKIDSAATYKIRGVAIRGTHYKDCT